MKASMKTIAERRRNYLKTQAGTKPAYVIRCNGKMLPFFAAYVITVRAEALAFARRLNSACAGHYTVSRCN